MALLVLRSAVSEFNLHVILMKLSIGVNCNIILKCLSTDSLKLSRATRLFLLRNYLVDFMVYCKQKYDF